MAKLVRDKIPEIMRAENKTPKIRMAKNDEEYFVFLQMKLLEEIKEFTEACISPRNAEAEQEMADILEVIETICDFKKYDMQSIQKHKNVKKMETGGFSKRILLISEYS